MKKVLRDANTARWPYVVKGGAKIFAPPQTPFPGAQLGRPKFNQLDMVIILTYKPSLVRIDARNFELSWSQTHIQTLNARPPARPPVANTQTGPITLHCAAKLSAQCNEKKRSGATQTLCAGCSKAERKKFALPQTPFPGARDSRNLISWRRSLPLPINPWSLMRIDARNFDLSW